jgi:hypothetical protein
MRLASIIVAVLPGMMLFGCANSNSIHRNFDVNSGTGTLIDIKQRAIIVSAQDRKLFKNDGNETHLNIICAEPSPDALSAYAAALGAKVDVQSKVNVELATQFAESSQFVGLRTQSIQLLRDSYYRICEAYMNRALDPLQYDILLRRYQKYTVALLGIEQLTGAMQAVAGTIIKPETTKPDVPKPDVPKADVPKADTDNTSAVGTNKAKQDNKVDMSAVSDAVKEIVLNILNTDDEGQLCFAYLNDVKVNDQSPLYSICKKYLTSGDVVAQECLDYESNAKHETNATFDKICPDYLSNLNNRIANLNKLCSFLSEAVDKKKQDIDTLKQKASQTEEEKKKIKEFDKLFEKWEECNELNVVHVPTVRMKQKEVTMKYVIGNK